MSSDIPKLTLFPLYPGGPLVRNQGGLTANTAYYTRATRFTPSYGVNIPNNTNWSTVNTAFSLDGNRLAASQPISAAQSYNTPLAFDGNVQGGLTQATVPAVAPDTPNLYKDAVEKLSISDLKFSELMSQADFRIPGIGMGLKVTTDGLGGVDKIELDPGSRGNLPTISAIASDFLLPNRVEITQGATFFRSSPTFDVQSSVANDIAQQPPQPLNQNAQADLNAPLDLAKLNLAKLNSGNGVFQQNQLEQLTLRALEDKNFDLDQLNLEKLFQLQPQENGIAIAGYDSVLDTEQSRQLAANQAGLNVNPSEEFRQNVAELTSTARQPQESYAAAYAPRMDEVMKGRLNIAAWQAGTDVGKDSGAFSNGNGFDMGSAVADATSRQSRGGSYLSFQMQSDTQGQGFGNANAFMGGGLQSGLGFGSQGQSQTDQQFRQPRRPMAFIA